jgi:hypothetical protein
VTDIPPAAGNATDANQGPTSAHPPFPAVRLLYAAGYAVIAWFVFWLVLILGLFQFGVIALNGHSNAELKAFNFSLVQYLWELLAFITFVRDEQPFPIGPFPKHA